MKLKYYLRGLGIGILVTAVIMGVTQGSRKETLSDREIRERGSRPWYGGAWKFPG